MKRTVLAIAAAAALICWYASAGTPLGAGRQFFPVPNAPVHQGAAVIAAHQTSAECAACHAEVAAEWAQSTHHTAYTDAFFQKAYKIEPEAACRNCHAPLAGATTATEAEGIGCATCHVRAGAIVANFGPEPAFASHPIARDAALGAAEYCAGCHQFGFLALTRNHRPRFETAFLQQTTYNEWQMVPPGAPRQTCNACHMPPVARATGKIGRKHVFAGRTPEMLAKSVAVTAATAVTGKELRVTFTLRNTGAGHAVPTGDLYRRMDLRLFDPTGKLVAVAHLGRQWQLVQVPDPGHGMATAKQLARDDRVPPAGVRNLSLTAALVPGLWRWQLDHVRAHGPPPAALGPCTADEICSEVARGLLSVN